MATKTRRPGTPSASERFSGRTRLLAGLLAFVLLGSLLAVAVITFATGSDNDGGVVGSGGVAVPTSIVPTDCPTADKSSATVLTFDNPPPFCLDPSLTYTAVFDTTEGQIRMALDLDRTPNTANNFVVLTNYGYYDQTLLFRLDPTIAIIQGGSPHTNSWSDPGPGYMIADEGGVFGQGVNGTVGPFTYGPGQLVMARSAGPNSSGAQFFLTSGEAVSILDNQGSYIVFGSTDAAGLAVLEGIMALYRLDPDSPYGGGRIREALVRSVTIVTG